MRFRKPSTGLVRAGWIIEIKRPLVEKEVESGCCLRLADKRGSILAGEIKLNFAILVMYD